MIAATGGAGARTYNPGAMPAALLPLLLATHVTLAIGLFLPSMLLPFALRGRRSATESRSPIVRGLLSMQSHGTRVSGVGLALTGIGLLFSLGAPLLGQPWLLAGLAIYALNLGLATFQRPNLRRLVGIRADSDDPVWAVRARRQRYVSYAMAGLVGTIAFLISTKPELW
jgi:hypothetical protein